MKKIKLNEELSNNEYPGRGIIIGKSEDNKYAITAYFIMGRSKNSRNRTFVKEKDGIKTQAFDSSQMTDPSLIIYSPVRVLNNKTIVTNGNQTDTIYDGLVNNLTFEQSLKTREFEPDSPNFTPRISGLLEFESGRFSYQLSILKSNNGNSSCCNRYTFSYDNPISGQGHFIHTYKQNGNPLPSFEGEPKIIEIDDNKIDDFTNKLWNNLNEDNKISLFVRYIEIETGITETRIINKNIK